MCFRIALSLLVLMFSCGIRARSLPVAQEALPHLRALLTDHALPRAGDQVSVADTAKAAIAKLSKER
jgi:hypothetical protein